MSVFTDADVNNEQEEDVSKNGIDSISQMAISGTDWTAETIVRQIKKRILFLIRIFRGVKRGPPQKRVVLSIHLF